jgi:hypothetical protein
MGRPLTPSPKLNLPLFLCEMGKFSLFGKVYLHIAASAKIEKAHKKISPQRLRLFSILL